MGMVVQSLIASSGTSTQAVWNLRRQREAQRTASKPRSCTDVTSALHSWHELEDLAKKYVWSTRALIRE